jgi:hypothetical protein
MCLELHCIFKISYIFSENSKMLINTCERAGGAAANLHLRRGDPGDEAVRLQQDGFPARVSRGLGQAVQGGRQPALLCEVSIKTIYSSFYT